MSKSILVIDTPSACIDCPCHFVEYYGKSEYCCVVENGLLENNIEKFKPDWCPLKEVPKKRNIMITRNNDYAQHFYIRGYNDCIDEILKECEGNETN